MFGVLVFLFGCCELAFIVFNVIFVSLDDQFSYLDVSEDWVKLCVVELVKCYDAWVLVEILTIVWGYFTLKGRIRAKLRLL